MHRAVTAAVLICLAGQAWSQDQAGHGLWPLDRTGLSVRLERQLAAALPYRAETRWNSYRALQETALMRWFYGRYSATVTTRVSDVYPGYPDLNLIDSDGDGQADFFAYYGEADDTNEFGALFRSSGGDGPLFWLVLNGSLVSDPQDTDSDPIWFTYHVADRDGDGRVDLMISNDLEFNGDEVADGRETVWIFDDDGDARFERAEYNIHGIEVAAAAGVQAVADLTGFAAGPAGAYSSDSFPWLAQAVFDDVSAALHEVQP